MPYQDQNLAYNAVGNPMPQRDASGWLVSPWGNSGGSAATEPTLTSYGISQAAQVNAQNRQAQTQANQARLGTAGVALQSTLLGNAQRKASGLLDPETEQMLRQGIAASGVSSGMGVDSANLASAYRRALGLDINAIQGQALNEYSQLTADNPGAQVVGVQSFLTQPATQAPSYAPSRGGGGGGGYAPAAAAAPVDPFGGYGGSGGWSTASTNPYTDVSGVYTPPANAASQNVNPFDVTTNDYGIPSYWPAANAGGGNTYQDWVDTFGGG